MVLVSDRDLQRLCDWWRDELNLKSWDIEARFFKAYEKTEYLGHIEFDANNYTAKVRIRREEHAAPDSLDKYDVETTLLHELVHLLFWSFSDYAKENRNLKVEYERATEMVARSLVRLKRGGE